MVYLEIEQELEILKNLLNSLERRSIDSAGLYFWGSNLEKARELPNSSTSRDCFDRKSGKRREQKHHESMRSISLHIDENPSQFEVSTGNCDFTST